MAGAMLTATTAPGVFWQPAANITDPALATGVPGFVGFVAGNAAVLARLEKLEDIAAAFVASGGSYLTAALQGFFDNGGGVCYVSGAPAAATDHAAALLSALAALAPIEDLDLVAMPDAMTLRAPDTSLDSAAVQRLQQAMLAHCTAFPGRFALLDPLPGVGPAGVAAQGSAVIVGQAEPIDGALYFPWVQTGDGTLVPPCGHIAGLIARTDAASGPGRAPAGAALVGVRDVEFGLDAATQGVLNAAGINGLRVFPGRGVRVWGARSLSREADWGFINVRRIVLTLRRWIGANLGWVAFEPHVPATWARIERQVTAHLQEQWRAGALAGATADQAFFVTCNAETNPPATRNNGLLTVEIGIAPARPAEFILVSLTLDAQAGG